MISDDADLTDGDAAANAAQATEEDNAAEAPEEEKT
jgi:hypothetical protein